MKVTNGMFRTFHDIKMCVNFQCFTCTTSNKKMANMPNEKMFAMSSSAWVSVMDGQANIVSKSNGRKHKTHMRIH